MKQLALALSARPDPTFGNFVVGRNAEAFDMLQAMARGSAAERFVYVWGAVGSGRSHLLASVAHAAAAAGRACVRLCAPSPASALRAIDADRLVVVDDADCLDADAQVALFDLYNRIREGAGGALLASGPAAPGMLAVRADLATRLAWGLVYEIQALDDDEKGAAMRAHASAHGFALPPDVQDYLLRHAPRDLATLLALVERLDRLSLEAQRPVTVPLAREVLQQMHGNDQEDDR